LRARAAPFLPTATAHAGKVNKAAFDINLNELHPHSVANIKTLVAPDDATFDRRVKDSYPRAFVRSPSNDTLKSLTDARL
jgi:hypothetical protein